MTMARVTDATQTFKNCISLVTLPSGLSFATVQGLGSTFEGCINLIATPEAMTFHTVVYGLSTFKGCSSLTTISSNASLAHLNDGTDMFDGVTLDTTLYSNLLYRTGTENTPLNYVTFDGGNSRYNSHGLSGRLHLTDAGFIITDGGPDFSFIADALVMEIDTTKPSTSTTHFLLPLESSTSYNFTIHWGDGTSNAITTYDAAELYHEYPASGHYWVEIEGSCPRLYFGAAGALDPTKLTRIYQWGDVNYSTNQTGAFTSCSNLVTLASDCTWMNSIITGTMMFYDCSKVKNLPAGMTLDALVTGTNMFGGCSLLKALATGTVLANLTNGNSMYSHCSAISSLPATLTLAALSNGTSMFEHLNRITEVPSGVTLSELTNGTSMFRDCTNLTTVSFTLTKLTNGTSMFYAVSLDMTVYSNLLEWASLYNYNNNVTFHGGDSYYNASNGYIAHNTLTGPKVWIITDGGLGEELPPWYLSGGVAPENCIAAYRPKGAFDASNALTNIANPGVYDCVNNGAGVSWTMANGWSFSGGIMKPGIIGSNAQSIIIRFSNGTTTTYMVGMSDTNARVNICPRYSDARAYFQAGGAYDVAASALGTAEILAVTPSKGYRNGSPLGSLASPLSGSSTREIWIGNLNVGGSEGTNVWRGRIAALAIYDTTLTDAQVAAISTAMAAF
jgi:hypothetical protein